LRIGRPRVVRDVVARAVVDLDDLARVDLDVAQPLLLVAEGELGRVGRPDGREGPDVEAVRHLPLGPRAVLRADVELILARAIAVVGDPPAVGRPRRVALAYALRVREVADLALLGRDGEELASRREDGARTRRRDVEAVDVLLHVLERRHGL